MSGLGLGGTFLTAPCSVEVDGMKLKYLIPILASIMIVIALFTGGHIRFTSPIGYGIVYLSDHAQGRCIQPLSRFWGLSVSGSI
jgi:hypothetical protein